MASKRGKKAFNLDHILGATVTLHGSKTNKEVLATMEEPPDDFDPFADGLTVEPKDPPKPSGQKRKRPPSPSPERETCPVKIEGIVKAINRYNIQSNNSYLSNEDKASAKKMVEQLKKQLPKDYCFVMQHYHKTSTSQAVVYSDSTSYFDGGGGGGAGNFTHGFGNSDYAEHGGSGEISIEDGQDEEEENPDW